MHVADTLRAARALIEHPDHWGRLHFVQNLPSHDCYCIAGAIGMATGDFKRDSVVVMKQDSLAALAALASVLPTSSDNVSNLTRVVRFNDARWRTHAEVLAAFDRAIAEASR